MMTVQCSKANADKLSLVTFNLGNTKSTPFLDSWLIFPIETNSNSPFLVSIFMEHFSDLSEIMKNSQKICRYQCSLPGTIPFCMLLYQVISSKSSYLE